MSYKPTQRRCERSLDGPPFVIANFVQDTEDRGRSGQSARGLVKAILRKITTPQPTAVAIFKGKLSDRVRCEYDQTMIKHAPASLIYVALGDSLTVGTGASYKGYVDRYADYLRTDTSTQVSVINLGQDGQTSSELLHALRNDAYSRETVSAASVITFNTGLNDLGHAGQAYENETCGGADNQDCLREAVEAFKENWDAIIAELLSLCSSSNTIIRTIGIGHTPKIFIDAIIAWPSEGK